MRLLDAYTHPEAVDVLWQLLQERTPDQNISHRAMPTLAQHKAFIESRPYPAWYLIDCGHLVGATYLTDRREIGIGILGRFKREGYGRSAIRMLMERHPGKFLANINPANRPSIDMFVDLGFNLLQATYAI